MTDLNSKSSDRVRVDKFLSSTIEGNTRQGIWAAADSILAQGPVADEINAGKTGLALGYVQSGKTTVITALIAAAADEGYQLVIALLGTKNLLLDQNLARLHEALELDDRKDYRWIELVNPKGIKKAKEMVDWAQRGRILFLPVLKHHGRIKALADCLESARLPDLPTLIIDDEADQTSLNTEAQRKTASRTYEAISALREKQPNHLFVQFTATPYAPLLLDEEDPLLPDFVEFLHPGPGYTGGREFFVDHSETTIRKINPRDEQAPKQLPTEIPASLEVALTTFFAGAAMLLINDANSPPISMLIHSTQRNNVQDRYHYLVQRLIRKWQEEFLKEEPSFDLKKKFDAERRILKEAGAKPVSDNDFYRKISFVLKECVPWLINSESDIKKVDWHVTPIHILVGGNKLDRGFTVEGLTVTYMNRPTSDQVDTLEQRARAFGYRKELLPFCQFFATQRTIDVLRDVVFTEYDLRANLRDYLNRGKTVTQWSREIGLLLPKRTKPTRDAVLSSLTNYRRSKSGWHSLRQPSLKPEDILLNNKVVEDSGLLSAYALDYGRLSHPTLEITLQEVRKIFLDRWCYPLSSPGWHRRDVSEILDRYPDQNITVPVILMAQPDGSPRVRKWDELGFVNLFQGRDNEAQPNGELYPGDAKVPRDFSEDAKEIGLALQAHLVTPRNNPKKPLYTLAIYLGGLETFKRRKIDAD